LRVGWREGADAHSLLLAQGDALDGHLLDLTLEVVLDHPAALGAEFALNVEAVFLLDIRAHLIGNQVQRLLVHWAITDGVDGACFGARVDLQPVFEQANDGRLTTTHWPYQQQDALAHFEALRGGVEVLDNLLQWLLDAEDIF